VTPRIADALVAEALLDLDERNGFTQMDFDRGAARVRTFGAPRAYVPPPALVLQPALELELG